MLHTQNNRLGAMYILLSELMFATMAATVKALSSDLPFEVIVFFRNLFGLIVISTWMLSDNRFRLRTDIFHFHLLRALMGTSAMYCFFYALSQLHLAEGLLLKMTAPFFIPLIAYFWLRETATRMSLLAIPVGFAGVYIIINPHGEYCSAALIGVLGGFLAAIAKVTVRRLGQTEPTLRIVFYFALIGTLISAVPLGWSWQMPHTGDWLLLITMGLVGTLGQTLLTRGYSVARTTTVAPFTYFSIVYGSVYGYLLWGEILDMAFILGALLIIVAGLLSMRGHKTTSLTAESLP